MISLFTGSIPSSIFNLSSLQEISLSFNKFSGHLSSDMFDHLPQLWYLDLSRNQLSGEIPTSLFKCKELECIILRDNQLEGTIPLELGNLTSLMAFDISENNFVGELKDSTCLAYVLKNKRVNYSITFFCVVSG